MIKIKKHSITIVIFSFFLMGCRSTSEPAQIETLIDDDLNGSIWLCGRNDQLRELVSCLIGL